MRPVLAGAVVEVGPLQEPVRPDSLVEVSAVQVVIPVEAQPEERSGDFVVDVDRAGIRAMWDALQEDQAAVGLNQALRSGVAILQKGCQNFPS